MHACALAPLQTPFACHAVDGVLKLYLDSVLPTALASVTAETKDLQPHVESIQQIFNQLKVEVTRCVSTRTRVHYPNVTHARPRGSAPFLHVSSLISAQ